MQIFIKHVSGVSTPMDFDSSSTIDSVKSEIENNTYLTGFTLMHAGKAVHTGSLAMNGIESASTLALSFPLNGGMRAKWRKKRMRRLRRKRRRMRARAK